MRKITNRDLVRLVLTGLRNEPGAAFVRHWPSGIIVQPAEIWLPLAKMYVRADGSHISGWLDYHDYEFRAFRPGLISRVRIRRAVRALGLSEMPACS